MDLEDLFYFSLVGGVCGHASVVQGPKEGIGAPGARGAGSRQLCVIDTGKGTCVFCSQSLSRLSGSSGFNLK